MPGPSPRVRGKPPERLAAHCSCGSIPARAGKPFPDMVRGVHDGSIPARAGKAVKLRWHLISIRVHPRACGGSASDERKKALDHGPSPRVRGKLSDLWLAGVSVGSIPARAGEAIRFQFGPCIAAVHPRACGGSAVAISDSHPGEGPSPRVRGKLWEVVKARIGLRSIPARAGETSTLGSAPLLPKVHPRAFGGNHIVPSTSMVVAGPSPRVRGKRDNIDRVLEDPRSIPARAGEAHRGRNPVAMAGVHPRACGGSSR